jgi:hypothetical protein
MGGDPALPAAAVPSRTPAVAALASGSLARGRRSAGRHEHRLGHDQSGLGPMDNPLAIQGFVGELARVVLEGSVLVIFGVMLASIVSLAIRFRRAQGVERQQFKWLVYAAAVVGVYLIASYFVRLPGLLDAVFQTVPLAVLPIAIGIAILRHRLYDIDVLINRTLVYSTLTTVLALVYIGSVLLLQQVLAPLTRSSDVELVVSTLAIVALFTPVRRRVQTIIDRRFYRHKYDTAAVLASFSSRVQSETKLDELTADVLSVVDQAVQPAHVSIWLRDAPITTRGGQAIRLPALGTGAGSGRSPLPPGAPAE